MSMTSSVHDIDEVTKQIKVTIPVEKVTQEFETALSEVSRTTRVKGFRPGKAPRSLVEKMHGKRLRAEVTQRLISTSLYDLVREHKIDMLGSPKIDVGNLEMGKEIEYTASISVLPKPEIKGYDKFKVQVPKREVTPARVDEMVEKLRESKATVKKLEGRDVAQKGDVVNADVSITFPGQEPSRPEPVVGSLGDGSLPKDLEDGIVGMKIGETKDMTVKLPEDHANPEMRGKDSNYKITLHTIYEKVLPALDDEFTKALVEYGAQSVSELKQKISEKLASDDEKEAKADAQTKLLDELLQGNEFLVPEVLVDDEIRALVMRSGIVDPSKIDPQRIPVEPFKEKLGEVASKRVKTAIIVDRIAEIEGLKVEDKDIEAAIEDVAKSNGVSTDEVRKFFLERSRVNGFLVEIARNKVLDLLMSRAEIEQVKEKA